MRLLLHGLNFSPEEIGIGKYSGEMVSHLVASGWDVTVVTTPPYYPQWRISDGFRGNWWTEDQPVASTPREDEPVPEVERGQLRVIRCPIWVPRNVTGIKRVIHLMTFAISSIPIVFWHTAVKRPHVIMTVEPAAMCMPTTLVAAFLGRAYTWLHVQDFEVDAAFELGILKSRWLKRMVGSLETWLMRRFHCVSSISPNMLKRLEQKGVAESRTKSFPNWVDVEAMRPLSNLSECRAQFGLPDDKCIALYSGNIGAKQGLDLIVEAARRCSDNSLLFVICGHGAAYQSVADSAAGLKNVRLLPVQPFELFNQLMNCADIHLLPQKADAADLVMPSKLTGMLATGRPVVACASLGTQIAEVVRDRGIVIPPGDSAILLQAVEKLAANEDLRKELGREARRYAVEHLSSEAILRQFHQDLFELVGHKLKGVDTKYSGIRGQHAVPFHGPELIPSPHLSSKPISERTTLAEADTVG